MIANKGGFVFHNDVPLEEAVPPLALCPQNIVHFLIPHAPLSPITSEKKWGITACHHACLIYNV